MKTISRTYILEGDVGTSYPDAMKSFAKEVMQECREMRLMGTHLQVLPLVMQTKIQPVAVLVLFASAIFDDGGQQ